MSNESVDSTVPKTYIKLRQLKPFICDICQKEFSSKIHYQVHSVIHLLPDSINCDECKEEFAHIFNLDKHLGTHKNHMCIICNVCKREFSDILSLNEHVKKHTTEPTDASTELQDTVKKEITIEEVHTLRCDKCNKEFSEKHHLDNHYQNDCTEKLLKSGAHEELGSLSVISKSDFHVSDDDEDDSLDFYTIDDPVSPENSQLCENVKSLAPETREQMHEKIVLCSQNSLNISQYTGEVCQKGFSSKNQLYNHIHIHALAKSFSCRTCKMKFPEKSLLAEHRLSHPRKKHCKRKATCNVCQKVLSSNYALKLHMLIHTGSRPYVCEVCSKGFTNDGNLFRHRIIHTGERRFQCETCGQRFHQKVGLNCHRKRMHEGFKSERKRGIIHVEFKPFICEICKKGYPNKKCLRMHQYVHSEETPYVCEICNKGFRLKHHLKSHQPVHTREKKIPFCARDVEKN